MDTRSGTTISGGTFRVIGISVDSRTLSEEMGFYTQNHCVVPMSKMQKQ